MDMKRFFFFLGYGKFLGYYYRVSYIYLGLYEEDKMGTWGVGVMSPYYYGSVNQRG